MKVAPNKIKVTVTFDKDEMFLPVFLAGKYADGCVADFIKEVMMNAFRDTFREDLEEVTKKIRGAE